MSTSLKRVRIVGSGLIGTSIGLGLVSNGIAVEMADVDPKAQALAQDLMGSQSDSPEVDLVIFAVPPRALEGLLNLEFQLNPKASFIDIGSVKSEPKALVAASEIPSERFLPSHPMAGREFGGAESARADLFISRPWIIDSSGVKPEVIAMGSELIALLGGHLIDMPAEEHDRAVARVSHLPQILSSLAAAQLLGTSPAAMELAGAGLRDTTRIAASDPKLWREIISSNASEIKPLLEAAERDLAELIDSLDDIESIERFMVKGRQGRALIPGKHGGVARSFTSLPIVIEDKPGQLAALFDECSEANVNVEDLTIEHSPEQFTGLITLALSADDAEKLALHLQKKGWSVHAPRGPRT